jgi:hypothetical protein
MNAWNERGKDSENFGARITEIGVAVAKIWWEEVIGTYLWFLEVARAISGIIFEITGPLEIFVDCGLISKKPRDLFAKFPE